MSKFKDLAIPNPSSEEVERYLKKWDSLENYSLQESSLRKLYIKTYPRNEDIDDVLIKVCALNAFYSTNIFSPFTVAKHIVSLGIDDALFQGNLAIVNKIADVTMSGGKRKNFYSFATKYCSHHRPDIYPIYDSYVGKVLVYFRKRDGFYDFPDSDLKAFSRFKDILVKFRECYSLSAYDLKQIDKYLWQVGKEYFVKKY